MATISIGQDRKYTIEGSSATDKDYPIKTKNGKKKKKQANQYLSDKIHRLKLESKNTNEENELKRQCQCECVLFCV